MNNPVPVTNNNEMPIYVAGVMIPAGETKFFPAHHVPEHLRDTVPSEAEPEAPADPIQELLAKKVPQLVASLPFLADDVYAALKAAEEAAAKPRKGLLNAFAEEDLRRADAAADADQGGDENDTANETEGTDGDDTAPADTE